MIVPLAAAEAVGTTFATSVGCGNQTAQCLRATSAAALVNGQPSKLATSIPSWTGLC